MTLLAFAPAGYVLTTGVMAALIFLRSVLGFCRRMVIEHVKASASHF